MCRSGCQSKLVIGANSSLSLSPVTFEYFYSRLSKRQTTSSNEGEGNEGHVNDFAFSARNSIPSVPENLKFNRCTSLTPSLVIYGEAFASIYEICEKERLCNAKMISDDLASLDVDKT